MLLRPWVDLFRDVARGCSLRRARADPDEVEFFPLHGPRRSLDVSDRLHLRGLESTDDVEDLRSLAVSERVHGFLGVSRGWGWKGSCVRTLGARVVTPSERSERRQPN